MKTIIKLLWLALVFIVPLGSFSSAWSQNQTQLEDFQLNDFTLRTLDGQEITLSKLTGKPVMVTFFLTTCSHCQAESAALNVVYNKYHESKEFQLIAIAPRMDSRENLVKFIDEYQITYPILHDQENQVIKLYGVIAVPHNIFIDREGRVKRVITGGVDLVTLEESLEELW
ncbi:peroxiredoxin family protein [Atribacter laminatus]|jgi:peroxiredoxin|uniref:Thiol-disulfide oxidoreductase ResA n=1 Tax=Atribacter laminatus TaxID=2847778 RepID=A0A7T1AM33_ATRLM|nr:TlpA disulfide reductase family protein [Atribacter laminatus]QPM68451.1 Thiol-disulfide oxidoreductase ResA [Atribacter laminatus]